MPVTRRTFLLAAVMLPVLGAPLLAQTPSLAGEYDVRGVEPDGSKFTGHLTLQQDGVNVRFIWNFEGEVVSGRGAISGRVVTVHYGERYPAIYQIVSENELHGTYENGAGLENLYRR